nr:MAG TPA: beta-N-acetylglucosaminidase [Caudoviricetes sp.]
MIVASSIKNVPGHIPVFFENYIVNDLRATKIFSILYVEC